MRVKMVCLEDGITATGFRKMAAYVERLNDDTHTYYVTTAQMRSFRKSLARKFGEPPEFGPDDIDEIARGLADADVIGFSSMTGYADLTKRVMKRVRELSPDAYVIWGGIHPIIYPEDAILADVDAICTGEGEFAFEELFDRLQSGADHREVHNFWFKDGDDISRNQFRPLMTKEELEELPFPKYGTTEWTYRQGEGFHRATTSDYLYNNGLAYPAIWSIGCPLHCTFCGNTVFIANDKNYRIVRHPSPEYMVREIEAARRVHPHLSTVMFHDDSFMAIPLRELDDFARLWRSRLDLPFSVYGVIPTYVKRDKFQVLTWAGLNRVRMGIQSGSERLLKFYRRPTPIPKVEQAAAIISEFSKYHINPSYDIIVDNPVETRQDVLDTLELVYRLARPFTLNIFSLKVIPNTVLEQQMRDEGLDLEQIDANFHVLRPSVSNILLYVLIMWRPPRALFDRWLGRVRACHEEQKLHPILMKVVRTMWLVRQGFRHLRFADFSLITGYSGYILWKLGVISVWLKLFGPRVGRAVDREGWHIPEENPGTSAAG